MARTHFSLVKDDDKDYRLNYFRLIILESASPYEMLYSQIVSNASSASSAESYDTITASSTASRSVHLLGIPLLVQCCTDHAR